MSLYFWSKSLLKSLVLRELVILSLVLLAAPVAVTNAAPSFMGLGRLPGGGFQFSGATGVSRDGTAVSGQSSTVGGTVATRWTAAGGLEEVGDLPGGGKIAIGNGISGDGEVVVGQSLSESAFGQERAEAFRWTETGGIVGIGNLGPIPAGNSEFSIANATSSDGSVIVGESSSPAGTRAFRWTELGGMVGLGVLPPGGTASKAFDVSADGTIVVGDSNTQAFRWTQSTGMVGLGKPDDPNIFNFSAARTISDNGRFIAGLANTENGFRAALWNEVGTMSFLGEVPGGNLFSEAKGVTDDGSMVVGSGRTAVDFDAFIWDATNGMRSLKTVLVNDFGLNLFGWTLTDALDITFDGTTIVGSGRNPAGISEGWIVTGLPATSIPEPSAAVLLLTGIFSCGLRIANLRGVNCPLRRRRSC